MKIVRTTAFLLASLVAVTAWAQSADQPLNLKLPSNLPASGASTAAPATANPAATTDASRAANGGRASAQAGATAGTQGAGQSAGYSKDPPGTYYGDTSGALGDTQAAAGPAPATVSCDDATYNQPQVHGEVTTGVVAGNHFSGNYTGGGVTLSQAFGSCEHPTGGVSISVGGTTGHFGR